MSEGIVFREFTLPMCHAFWKSYVADPDMLDRAYEYDPAWVDRYYREKVCSDTRRVFAVCVGGEVIGEVMLKRIDPEKGCAVLSIHLAHDGCKNRGYGTAAERYMIEYGFRQLGLHTIYADCVHRNKRSRHVLEKVGFRLIREDSTFRYYEIRKAPVLSEAAEEIL